MKKGKIHFFSEDVSFSPTGKKLLRNWIKKITGKEKKKLLSVNFIFCSDRRLAYINRQFLNHDTLTDIITFDNNENAASNLITADIFISIDRVKENASLFKNKTEEELRRVMIHGILHLCGYKDKTPHDKKQMKAKEDYCLSLFAPKKNKR